MVFGLKNRFCSTLNEAPDFSAEIMRSAITTGESRAPRALGSSPNKNEYTKIQLTTQAIIFFISISFS